MMMQASVRLAARCCIKNNVLIETLIALSKASYAIVDADASEMSVSAEDKSLRFYKEKK